MVNKAKTRSPLRERPLRVPGQSVDRRLLDVLLDGALPWFLAATFLVVLAAMEWLRYLMDSPPSPRTVSVIALIVVAVAALRIRRYVTQARRLSLGRDGEQVVAETLQELVSSGWRILHDIPGENFNVDHVAIGPAGVLAIETKTRSKPVGRKADLLVTDAGISVDGVPPDQSVIEQASRQAKWLATLLRESTGKTFNVRPVILFPGWFIEDKRRRREPWILERKELPAWLKREPVTLQEDDIALAAFHLSRYIRTSG